MSDAFHFHLSADAIHPATLLAALADPAAGAVVTFDGRVRDHNDGRSVVGLEYHAYPALAERTGQRIVAEEAARAGALRAVAVHRTGRLAVGEVAVWVGVAAGHRAAAFDAARAIIERIKHELPVWKKECYADGSTAWVGPDNHPAENGLPPGPLPEWNADLLQILVSPGHDFRGRHGQGRLDHGIVCVDEVECVAGQGLRGDRYFGHKEDFKGQVTFLDFATVEAVRRNFGAPNLPPAAFRRNLVVRGVRLADWVGRRFLFQGVVFEGAEECRPCYWMDEAVAPGVEEFLKANCGGGLRARILTTGVIHSI